MNIYFPKNNLNAAKLILYTLFSSVVNISAARRTLLSPSTLWFISRAARRTPLTPSTLWLIIILLFAHILPAQTGWDHIRRNDFVSAKSAFETSLAEAPNDEATITGLLFLTETLRDELAYKHYVNQLLTKGRNSHYIWLFDHLYSGRPETILQQDLHFSLKIPFIQALADSLFRIRQFEESQALRRQIVPDWQWAVTGPFTNVGGSGFIESTPVETSPFSWTDTFRNEQGQVFHWVKRSNFTPGEAVRFDQLPASGDLGVYYAHTYLKVAADREADLCVSRHQPVKIWLDDQLILDRPRPAAAGQVDQERLRITLRTGTHRLLVKVADFPEEPAGDRLGFYDFRGQGSYINEEELDYEFWDETNAQFTLRWADPASGATLSEVQSTLDASYQPAAQPLSPVFEERPHLTYFKNAAESQPSDWWRVYLLAKAFAKYQAMEEGEAYFANWQTEHPGAAFGKYLLAKFNDANDHNDRAEALLSEMDTVTTPTYAEHFFRLEKIDTENNEAEYLAAMEKILQLSPTNESMLNRYLSFLQEKGRKEQLRDYIKEFLDKYRTPYWEKELGTYLEDESYKPEGTSTKTDREREKEYKQALKDVRRRFVLSDYETLLRFYRQKEREADVLKTFDELIRILPESGKMQYRKARYLFERDRNEEALAILTDLTRNYPFNGRYCETIGDIYIEKKDESQALTWYRRAADLSPGMAFQVEEKIDKLNFRPPRTRFFTSVDLPAVARDTSGLGAYAAEESYIQLFSQQMVYDPETQIMEAVRKVIIRINSETGARLWTEADLRLLGEITSARVLKKDGTVSSPNVGWGMAVFKNLQAGDVILVEGGGKHDMPNDIPNELLFLAPLSWPVPVARATMELVLPDTQEVYFAANRIDATPSGNRDTAGLKIMQWDWRGLAKLEDEDATPDNYDAMAWLMIGSAADWSKVVQWYERLTYARTEVNYEVRQKAREIIQPGMTPEEKVRTLHQFITRDINYSYVPFMNSNFVPKKPGATLAGKIGDCKDVATLMIALLREQGIPAWYTLVSTHQFSNTEALPALYIFNHAIVAYELDDGLLRFADLTTDYFATGILPAGDCDAWALIIRPGETRLRRLPNQLQDTTSTSIEIQAQARIADGNLHMDIQAQLNGVVAGNWREVMLGASPEDRRKEISTYLGGGTLSHTELEGIHFTNMDDVEAPLQVALRMNAYQVFNQVLDFQIMPLPLPMSLSPEKALFAARRYNDLDLDALFEIAPVVESIDLELPDHLSLAEIPGDRTVESSFGRYELRFVPIAKGLRIERRLVFHQRFIDHTEFEDFKKFYQEVLNADRGMVVLK